MIREDAVCPDVADQLLPIEIGRTDRLITPQLSQASWADRATERRAEIDPCLATRRQSFLGHDVASDFAQATSSVAGGVGASR